MHKGIATFTLDYGQCPKWLFERMVKLGREMTRVLIAEYGPEEFVKRIADPVWFQSLGTILAFDWNASGLTTILTAALKEAIRGQEKELGVFICGGKGKTSLKTPEEITQWGTKLALPSPSVEGLVYNSKMSAKVDSCLVQDGFTIYHHSFFFSFDPKNKKISWAVVQQGMNTEKQTARRYHWFSDNINDLVCEPHSGIASDQKTIALNLTAQESTKNRNLSTELVSSAGYHQLMKDIKLLEKYSSPLHQLIRLEKGKEKLTALNLKDKYFNTHPVIHENFSQSKYLQKILYSLCEEKPENYEKLLAKKGVGPKTIRALSLVGEIIYGAKPSYTDPARYSFAHGGKDHIPYPVDTYTYDQTITTMRKLVNKMKIDWSEKRKIFDRLT